MTGVKHDVVFQALQIILAGRNQETNMSQEYSTQPAADDSMPAGDREVSNSIIILMADDDPDDCLLAREAMKESRVVNEMRFVHDGEELMDYLHRRGKYSAPGSAPRPGLILLDLNMPLMDGREALREIKADPALKRTPVIILTTSRAEEDIVNSYDLGVNSFIVKPVTFSSLVNVMNALGKYWIEIVELPSHTQNCSDPNAKRP